MTSIDNAELKLAEDVAIAFRQADNDDRLVFPSEVLLLLDCFDALWPHYHRVLMRTNPGLYDQITLSLQPGTMDSYPDPRDAASAMRHLMVDLRTGFDERRDAPEELIKHARRVRGYSSNVAGCARAVSRVLHSLLAYRQRPRAIYKRLPHALLVARPLRPARGALQHFESQLLGIVSGLTQPARPKTTRA